jgi:hypothetical protein
MRLSVNAKALLEGGRVPGWISAGDLPDALGQISRQGRMRLLENLHERVVDLEHRLADDPRVKNWASQSLDAARKRIALVESVV